MEDIVSLRRQRGCVKAKMTRLEGKMAQAGEAAASREATEVYLARLDDIRSEFEKIQLAIAVIGLGEATGSTVADSTEEADFEERYLEIKIKLKQWLNRLPAQSSDVKPSSLSDETLQRVLQQQSEFLLQLNTRQTEAGMSNSTSQASSVNSDAVTRLLEQQTALMRQFVEAGGAANQESRVRLPMGDLPKFNGRSEEWRRFFETWNSITHTNARIPKIQKFQYLVMALSGVAAKIIESIDLTEENYDIAWDLLKKRFDDPRAIKKKHIECLCAMPRVERKCAAEIRNLIDYTLKHVRVLKSLESPTDSWGDLIVHMIETKLDVTTLRAWEQEGNTDEATLETLADFLETRCEILERIEARTKEREVAKKSEPDKQKPKLRGNKKSSEERVAALTTSTDAGKCYLCRGEHFMYNCEKFLSMSIDDRIKEVRRLKLCTNCLRNDHFVKTCKMGSCRECSGRHNTLCHCPVDDNGQRKEETREPAAHTSSDVTVNNVVVHHAANRPTSRHVLMATAVVNARHPKGAFTPIRILLDSASEAHFITHSACTKLGLKRERTSEIVTGLSEIESVISESCEVVVQSRFSEFGVVVRSLVVPKITKNLPSIEIDRDLLKIPSNIKLADVEFHKRGAIDMLIGAEFFFSLLESGRIELGGNRPLLQNTKLGWTVSGPIECAPQANLLCNRETMAALTCSLEQCETLDRTLRRFWEIENCQSDKGQALSKDARESEEFFERTTTRDESGRFVVRLPFLEDPKTLGESRESANKRLAQLERRFKGNKILRDRYVEFMREYLESGHMSLATDQIKHCDHPIVYLPHHGVIKESSTSTKLRAVFDASNKTRSGKSLNDILRVGPTTQSSLHEVIVRFRFYNVALTGDIRKMYRQVLVHPDDRDCQRILWRFSTDEPVQDFRLNTVIYGEASSSYLAIRCIRKLAEEAKDEFPIASRIILDQFYVDDILAGANDVADAAILQQQLSAILSAGGFEAHKWCSNHPEALQQVPLQVREDTSKLSIDTHDTIGTLGLNWRPIDDHFQFCVQQTKAVATKREVLSAISKFFDPLGLIGPIITAAKLIMQEAWRSELRWDEPLPATLIEKWNEFRRDLNEVERLSIPRRVIPCERASKIFLQGFCDASESAYGACIYIQAMDEWGNYTSRILCSKSRVAPIKPTTIPRLELCSAVLLSHLITNVRRELRVQIDGIQAWSDSQVALWWIRGDPQELSQLMGPLPRDRVNPSRPFAITDVDFAGPIITLVNKGRGRKTNKSYIAVFVCFATKAVHLEAVSELTAAAFLATLRRFTGRRGHPQRLYSDNATNFVGTNNELWEIFQFASAEAQGHVGEVLSNEGVEWKFIPPRSPHMGGLWEAGVKSCKFHLKRIMGNALFTYEELSTALAQIEACLNSRPLTALTSDSSDLQPLTPAHFLVGGPLTSLPDSDLTDVGLNRLDRWKLVQRVVQDFWKRWAAEYLTSLQGRTKWKREQTNLKIGDLVLLRDENLAPLKWKLGRVLELHPGGDGLVRVVTVWTNSGKFKRTIAKLCKLPVPSTNNVEISDPNLVGGMLEEV